VPFNRGEQANFASPLFMFSEKVINLNLVKAVDPFLTTVLNKIFIQSTSILPPTCGFHFSQPFSH